GGLCLLGIIGRAAEIACCGLQSRLSETSVDSVRKAFGDLLKDLHRFSTLLLILQLSPIRIKLLRIGDLERVIPNGLRFIRTIQGFEDVRLGAEVVESFLSLN